MFAGLITQVYQILSGRSAASKGFFQTDVEASA